MKKYKLKSWVITAVYALALGTIAVSTVMIGKYLSIGIKEAEPSELVAKDIVDTNEYDDVINVVEITNETVNHPFLHDGVEIAKDYYDKSKSIEDREKGILFYKNTYMQNTGILYTGKEKFDVVSVLDGTVTSITKDEILGNVIEIAHTNELITVYHCLEEVNVKVGDSVKQNDVIGKSGYAAIDGGYDNALLFEVNYKGEIINPVDFYNMKISDLMV